MKIICLLLLCYSSTLFGQSMNTGVSTVGSQRTFGLADSSSSTFALALQQVNADSNITISSQGANTIVYVRTGGSVTLPGIGTFTNSWTIIITNVQTIPYTQVGVATNQFPSGQFVIPAGGSAILTFRPVQGVWYVNSVSGFAGLNGVATIASASTIAPAVTVNHITGTSNISTITPPTTGFIGSITLIADAAFTTDATGNISAAMTAVAGTPYVATYDGAKWYIK